MKNAAIDYEGLEKSRASALDSQLQRKLESKETGKTNSLKHTILSYIVEGKYDVAKEELVKYVERQHEFPNFKTRTERFVSYSLDVIQAIKTKRNFPGMHTLPLSKQQEILEKVVDHFEELKHFLNKIEISEKEVKLDDLRSTVWVIRALSYSIFALVLIFFLRTTALSLLYTFDFVVSDYADQGINWIFDSIEK